MQGACNLAQFKKAAQNFAQKLVPLPNRATVIGLYGDLGSGKTAFVQAVGRVLGIKDPMQSPTFVIEKRFRIYDLRFKNLIHMDVYRLRNGEELRRLGFSKLLTEPENLILVEWADRVADILPPDHIKLIFEFIDEHTRKITRHDGSSPIS